MKLSVVIQAGGASRRMGRDKALVPFLGVPLVQRVRDRMAGIGDELILTTNQMNEFSFLGLSCFPDLIPDRGALGGLYTALSQARHPLVAVLACDLPFANPELIRLACERMEAADVVIPESRSGLEPLHSLYRREACLPAIRAALDAGKWRVDSWFEKVRVRILARAEYAHLDPGERTFINVNTPEELALAEALATIPSIKGVCDRESLPDHRRGGV
jgi:molybdopterin-guanine dinucleotide biosynthesis protein A